nr:phosphoethanolamine transferase [uncultured Bacteroides sp.]
MRKALSYKVTFILFFILNFVLSVCYNIDNEKLALLPKRLILALINSIGVSVVLLGILFIFYRYLKLNLRIFFLCILFIIDLVESFVLITFNSLITPSIILVILETNMQEISEFFDTAYFDVYTCLTLLVIIIIAGLCLFFIHKLDSYHFPKFFNHSKLNVYLAVTGGIVYILLSYYTIHMRKIISYPSLTGIERLYYSIKVTLHDRIDYQRIMSLVKKAQPEIRQVHEGVSNIVLILGESLSKVHMNCYGYSLPTTPYLNERIKNGEIVVFDSVMTRKTVTVEALKVIMSFYNHMSERSWYEYYMLPTVMQSAGYNTFWLSNQESFGVADFNISAAIASSAEKVIYTHQRHTSEDKVGYFDEGILPFLDDCIGKGWKNFYVCHLMGSHWRYANRYPEAFNKFNSEDIKNNKRKSFKKIIAEYDNSVLYNDYVVNEIIKRFQKSESIILYFPDHGEEVYDTQNMNGHRMDNPTLTMMEIPFFVWMSKTMQEHYSSLVCRIKKATSNQFYTENIIHTVLDIGGIELSGYDATKSLFYNEEKTNIETGICH